MTNIIGMLYKWFWRDFLCRLEPFTYQFRRQKQAWGVVWWIVSVSGLAGGIGFGVWLFLHIIGIT